MDIYRGCLANMLIPSIRDWHLVTAMRCDAMRKFL